MHTCIERLAQIRSLTHTSTNTHTDVQAELEGPQGTPYEQGLFRIRLCLGAEYPQAPPKGFFATKIFHPNVSPAGEICVNVLKKVGRVTLFSHEHTHARAQTHEDTRARSHSRKSPRSFMPVSTLLRVCLAQHTHTHTSIKSLASCRTGRQRPD